MPPKGGIFLSAGLALENKLAYDLAMRMILLVLLFMSCGLQADIYRSVDKNGNVTFTDEPNAAAERIELEELTTYEPIPIADLPIENTADSDNDNDNDQESNYSISITSPEQNESTWGSITASVSVQPRLKANNQDKVQFKLDGKNVGEPQTGLSYTFDNVERGSHILVASVVDNNGKVLSTSKSVLFQMHRTSVINNNRNFARP